MIWEKWLHSVSFRELLRQTCKKASASFPTLRPVRFVKFYVHLLHIILTTIFWPYWNGLKATIDPLPLSLWHAAEISLQSTQVQRLESEVGSTWTWVEKHCFFASCAGKNELFCSMSSQCTPEWVHIWKAFSTSGSRTSCAKDCSCSSCSSCCSFSSWYLATVASNETWWARSPGRSTLGSLCHLLRWMVEASITCENWTTSS